MKPKKVTLVRTIGLGIVIINMVLEKLGIDIINVSENQIVEALEIVLEGIVIVAAWWKNNSFSKVAIIADEYLQELKNTVDVEDVQDINELEDAQSLNVEDELEDAQSLNVEEELEDAQSLNKDSELGNSYL